MTSDERADHELVHAALSGDARIRRELVERLLPTVRSRVMHALMRYKQRGQAEQVAEDLTQQVFLVLFEDGGRRLRAWEPGRGASLTTFVGLLSEREVIGILRRERRNPWTEAPTPEDELVGRAGASADQTSALENRQMLNVVLDRVLATLDDRALLLFQRVIVDEAPMETVAREVGMSIAALYMWKSRFAKLVRDRAGELAEEDAAPTPAPVRVSRPVSLSLQPAWRTR